MMPFIYLLNVCKPDPTVYRLCTGKIKPRQIVVLGEANEKNVIVEKGLDPGDISYLSSPPNPEDFKLAGEDLIPILKAHK